MAKAHAILAPSSAGRWLACPPSARFEEQIPEEDSQYSREGTLAHDLAALILESRAGIYEGSQARFNADLLAIEDKVADFYESIGQPNGFNAMLDYAEDWAAFVRQQIPMVGKMELLVEKRLDMSKYAPVCFGTTDACVMTSRVLYVDDYKFGTGVRVSAVENKQMMLYALGALLLAHEKGFDPNVVVMSIYQPRVSEIPSQWELDTADLLDWAEDVLAPKAKLAIAGQGDFNAGKHCQFCKARTMCRAYYDHFEDLLRISDKRQMTGKDLGKVLAFGPQVQTWLKKVIDETRAKMQNGMRVEGFKLVAGRQTRKFISEDETVDILIGEGYDTDDMFRVEMRPLTELEALLGKKRFAALMAHNLTKVEGNPQIVDGDDDRPAIDASGADDYEDDLL